MYNNNFYPAITYINLYTDSNSPHLALYQGKENRLTLEFAISGLNDRSVTNLAQEDFYFDYTALHITLFHQFGGEATTTVRRYVIEYDPTKEIFKDISNMIIDIPIDDDFSGINFVSNYYYLQMSFTHKHLGEMGVSESVEVGKFFETKIPFKVISKEKKDGRS